MPLNYLLHRHQVSLMRASAADGAEARRSHMLLAEDYARRIDALMRPVRDGLAPLVPLT